MVGFRYWIKPIRLSGALLTASEKQRRGTAVTTPEMARRNISMLEYEENDSGEKKTK